MVNSIAFKHYARWDFSRDQKYALSDKTKRFLDTLKGKMRVNGFSFRLPRRLPRTFRIC